MSLPKDGLAEMPEETRRVAFAALLTGSFYMRMREYLGKVHRDK